jgi:hypothetical protein
MVKAHPCPVTSPPARAVTAPFGRPIVHISHIPAADGFVKSDVIRQRSSTGHPCLTPVSQIGAEYRLADVAKAHEEMESGRSAGSILLIP